MKTLVKEINTTANGTTELFSVENNYIEDSVLVTVVDVDNVVKLVDAIELGNNFIQITPAPTGKLIILYEYDNPSVVDVDTIIPGLKPWDSTKILKLITAIQDIQTSVLAIEGYLKQRVSKQEFNSWSYAIETKIKELQALIGWLQL